MSEGGAEVGRQSRLVRFAFALVLFGDPSSPRWCSGGPAEEHPQVPKSRTLSFAAYSAAPPLLQRSRSGTTPATIAGEFVGQGSGSGDSRQ